MTTPTFGPGGAPLADPNGPDARDANRDRVRDLLARSRTVEIDLAFGDTHKSVKDDSLDGTPFAGAAAIRAFRAKSRARLRAKRG